MFIKLIDGRFVSSLTDLINCTRVNHPYNAIEDTQLKIAIKIPIEDGV